MHPEISLPKKFGSLESVRALAALAVIVFHAGTVAAVQGFIEEPTGYSYWGKYGVHVFFCLSGFVICYVHFDDLGKPERCPNYLWRRWARIWPLYAVLTLAQVAYSLVTGDTQDVNPTRVITSLLFLDLNVTPIIVVGWTLVHEAFFYLSFVLFLLVHRNIAAWGFLGFLGLQTVVEFSSGGEGTLAPWVFHQLRWYFISGIGAALVIRDFIASNRLRLSVLPGIQIGLMLLIMIVTRGLGADYELTTLRMFRSLMIEFVLVGLVVAEIRGYLSFPAFLKYLGKASYSIYLVHATFLFLGLKILASRFPDLVTNHIYAVMTTLGLLSVVVGIVTHETLEKFLNRMTRKLANWYQSGR